MSKKNKTGQRAKPKSRSAPSKPDPELEREQIRARERVDKRRLTVQLIGQIAPTLFATVGVVTIVAIAAWAVVWSAPHFAGKDTDVSLTVDIAATILGNLDIGAVVIAIGYGLFWRRIWRRENALRTRETNRLGSERRQEQLQRDPNRESSGFVPDDAPAGEKQ